MNNSAKVGSNPFDIFVIGARKGFNIAINNLMPNVLMAYVIAEMLNLLGVMQIIGHVCAPLMGLFGLPGEAITVLLTSWLSASAGTGVAVSLLSKGTLNVAISRFSSRRFSSWVRSFSTWGACSAWRMSRKNIGRC